MNAEQFTLTKRTGSSADALAVSGLARLVFHLSGVHPVIDDAGGHFTVGWTDGGRDLDALDWQSVHDDPGYPYVRLKPDDPAAPPGDAFIDYPRERERLLNWRKRRDALTKAGGGRRTPEDEEALKADAPMTGWYLYQIVNIMQGFNSYNALHAAIRGSDPEKFGASVRAKLVALAEGRDPASVSTPFAPKVAAVQVFNPGVGKGINRPKPDGPSLSGLPDVYVDWFEEWLRFIGVALVANAYAVGDDVKMVVLSAARVDDALMQTIRGDFVGLPLAWSSVKIDVLGALGLAGVLINRSGQLAAPATGLFKRAGPRTPRDVIAGLYTTYFTSLGNAKAVTNTSFIGLPGWFPIESAEDWKEVLSEHETVLKALNEERSEQAALLQGYRNFLSAGDRGLDGLLTFLGRYAGYYMRARDRGQYAPAFTVANLGRILMSLSAGQKSLGPILENEGFKHVATALRRATVSEQFAKARTGRQTYEIRYGLFQDLERKARFKDQFVVAISGFIKDYNNENARFAERTARPGSETGGSPMRRRSQVTTDDIDQLIALIDSYGSETVALLLLAYGSARETREAAEDTDTTQAVAAADAN